MPPRMSPPVDRKPWSTRNLCVTHEPWMRWPRSPTPPGANSWNCSRRANSRPAVSRHLRVLREAGLVRSRVDGKRRMYALDPRPLRELDDWLERYRDLWAQRLDALDTEIA